MSKRSFAMIFPLCLRAAIAGPRCVPKGQGAQARAARRRGRALKAAQPSTDGPAALFLGETALAGEPKKVLRPWRALPGMQQFEAHWRRLKKGEWLAGKRSNLQGDSDVLLRARDRHPQG